MDNKNYINELVDDIAFHPSFSGVDPTSAAKHLASDSAHCCRKIKADAIGGNEKTCTSRKRGDAEKGGVSGGGNESDNNADGKCHASQGGLLLSLTWSPALDLCPYVPQANLHFSALSAEDPPSLFPSNRLLSE